MHEWALAEAVVATAKKTAQDQQMREVKEIAVKLGELQQIEREIFECALQQLLSQEESLLRQAKINLETERARFKCRTCGREWAFEKLTEEISEAIHFIPEMAHTYIRCPRCQSPDFEVIKGRGVWLASLKGV
jgi:hydrogenase nickel incorporation protein HypA/HybF